jgi:hypothetical protein
MTFKEALYDIRESVKALNIDSDLTDRQIAFLMRIFRSLVIRQFITNNPGENREMLTQTLRMELELVDRSRFPSYITTGTTLLSTKITLPNIVGPMMYKHIDIRPVDIIGTEIEFIHKSRAVDIEFAPVNFIYGFREDDGKIYLVSSNSQYKNLTSVNVTAVFENPEEVHELNGFLTDLDVYPITSNLWVNIKEMILQHIVKEMSIPIDTISNKNDEQLSERT